MNLEGMTLVLAWELLLCPWINAAAEPWHVLLSHVPWLFELLWWCGKEPRTLVAPTSLGHCEYKVLYTGYQKNFF